MMKSCSTISPVQNFQKYKKTWYIRPADVPRKCFYLYFTAVP